MFALAHQREIAVNQQIGGLLRHRARLLRRFAATGRSPRRKIVRWCMTTCYPHAQVELLGTGHFALEIHAVYIAQRIRQVIGGEAV